MAITLVNKPYPVMAAFNGNYFEMSSTNSLQTGFKYLIRITIEYLTNSPGGGAVWSFTQLYEITPETNKNGFFDASVITSLLPLEPLLNTTFSEGKTFTRRAVGNIEVEFAEYFNGSPQPPPPADPYDPINGGAKYTYLTWEASKRTIQLYKQYPDYAYWIEKTAIPLQGIEASLIQNLETEYVYENSSTYLSLLDYNSPKIVEAIIIKVYSLSGVLQTVSTISNPLWDTTLLKNTHTITDVGMPSLRGIIPSAGTNPILPAGIDFYYTITVQIKVTGAGLAQQFEIKKYIPKCEPVFNPYVIHYKSRLGSWETCLFDKASSRALERDLKQYGVYTRVEANQLTNSQYKNPIYARSTDRVMNITTNEIYNLNTGWLSEAEVEKYSDLFDSPQIYLEYSLPDANVQFEVLAIPNTYVINKKYNKKKYSLNMSFKFAAKENRQR